MAVCRASRPITVALACLVIATASAADKVGTYFTEVSTASSSLKRKLLGFVDYQQGQPPFRSDVVVVFASTTSRMAIIQATQTSRKGVRTFVVNDKGPALDGNGVARKQIQLRIFHRPQVFGAFKGAGIKKPASLTETRIALAPFLANATLGINNYKWLLFGHDDTVWMMENTLKLLRGLDPDQPHLITDNLWFRTTVQEDMTHPNLEAPFCLACRPKGYSDLRMRQEGGRWKCILSQKEAPLGCPCNRTTLAANVVGQKLLDPSAHDFKDARQKAAFRIHLGGGVIMSRGLFTLDTFERVQSWIFARTDESADAIFTSVIWDLLRVAPSSPGFDYCRSEATVFDPGWIIPRRRAATDPGGDGGNDPLGVLQRLDGVLEDDGRCDKACLQRVDSMVSVHVRQQFASQDLPPPARGMLDVSPRYNATVTLINMLTDRTELFQRQRWAQEQAFMAAENR